MKSYLLCSALAAIALLSPDTAEQRAALARKYVTLQFDERSPKSFDLLSEDFDFSDPTAEFFGTPSGLHTKGLEAFKKIQATWNLEASRFEKQHQLVLGEYAVTAGTLSWKSANRPNWIEDVPFTTILRIQDGKVTERRDYGAYDARLPELPAGKQELLMAADAYMEAYAAMDTEALDTMLAENAVMVDANSIGDPIGRDVLLDRIAAAREVVSNLHLKPTYTIACSRHVLYIGKASMRYRGEGPANPAVLEYPYLVVLEFVDGAVVEHRRYLNPEDLQQQSGNGG